MITICVLNSYYIPLFFISCQSKGFDDMDSIYASPADFHQMKQRDKIRGLHLLEYFVNQCHQLGVIELGNCSEKLLIFICSSGSS